MPGQRLKQQRQALARFLAYVLGHRPDEFGLFPDEEGYIPIKDLLAALSEEEGWRHVRRSHIDDLLREPAGPGFEISEKAIRVAPADSNLTLGPFETAVPPKLLYHAARRKGYPVILEHGLKPGARPFIPFSTEPDLAMRIGKRRDPEPVLITVQAARAVEKGMVFYRPQEQLFLAESLAPDFFTGPPLPKEKPATEKKKKAPPPTEQPTPGSFFLEPDRFPPSGPDPGKGKKKKKGDGPEWKRATRKERRKKGGKI